MNLFQYPDLPHLAKPLEPPTDGFIPPVTLISETPPFTLVSETIRCYRFGVKTNRIDLSASDSRMAGHGELGGVFRGAR